MTPDLRAEEEFAAPKNGGGEGGWRRGEILGEGGSFPLIEASLLFIAASLRFFVMWERRRGIKTSPVRTCQARKVHVLISCIPSSQLRRQQRILKEEEEKKAEEHEASRSTATRDIYEPFIAITQRARECVDICNSTDCVPPSLAFCSAICDRFVLAK